MTQSETAKRSYEDYLSESSFHSSCPESHLMLPRMMTSENGDQKCVYNQRTAVFARRKREDYLSESSSHSSSPDSPLMLPRMMADENGDQKCVYNERTANNLMRKAVVARRKRDKHVTATNHTSAVHATADKRDKAGAHGLAPLGMIIPTTGNAFRFGGGSSVKEPLKESNLEMYNRIQAEKEVKAGRKNRTAVKKLKKEGKVSTLASFMYSKR
jgi:hypothetical protein